MTAAAAPAREPLIGERVVLAPVDPAAHAAALYAASHDGADPHLWEYLSYGPFADQETFRAWLAEAAASRDPLFFAILAREEHRPLGVAAYLRIEPQHRVIEIGHIWFTAAVQRTPLATEAIFLLARHAFDDLGYRRLEWKCDALNARSRRAAARFGFAFEGVFRQHMIVKGRNRDTAWFAIVDGEWPVIRTAFERWLHAENFGADGRQRRSLASLRERS